MRTFLLIAFINIIAFSSKAQSFLPGNFIDYSYRGNPARNINFNDSASNKKWSLSKYSGISTTFSFFKGGNATVVSAPLGLQLNRKLNNNLYAFAGVLVAPSYVNFRSSFMNSDFNKFSGANFLRSGSLGIYSRAEMGLMYINDEKTFSISGSIGIERRNYSMPGFAPVYAPLQNSNWNN